MIEFDGTCGSCPLNWVDYKYSESTVCAVTRKDVEDADKCDCPTERRAALMEQLSPEDREALELGCRVKALTQTDAEFRGRLSAWAVFFKDKRKGSLTTTPLATLRNANIGNGWKEKGEESK